MRFHHYGDGEREWFERSNPANRCLTPADWSAGRTPTGICYGYRWVNQTDEHRTKEDWPYSYSEHYVCGEPDQGDEVVYSDRLHQWNGDAWKRAIAAVPGKCFNAMSLKDASAFLTAYWQKEIIATAVAEGCNISSGYPYWIFWYHDANREAENA